MAPPGTGNSAASDQGSHNALVLETLEMLKSLEQEIGKRASNLSSLTKGLEFLDPPTIVSTIPSKPTEIQSEVNFGPLSLKYQHHANLSILGCEESLHDAFAAAESAVKLTGIRARLKVTIVRNAVHRKMIALYMIKHDEWNQQYHALKKEVASPTKAPADVKMGGSLRNLQLYPVFIGFVPEHYFMLFQGLCPVSPVAYTIAAVCYLLCSMLMDQSNFILSALRLIVQLAQSQLGKRSATQVIEDDIPRDIRTVARDLSLDPVTTEFVCCPKCFCCYPFDSSLERCTHEETPTSQPCGRLLRKQPVPHSERKHANSPTKVFVYQDFKAWLGCLHIRAEIEKHLDAKLPIQEFPRTGIHQDIWDSPLLQNFCGPDGQPFISVKGSEGCYIFSLNMDGFNPFGMRQAGKKASSGAIYMVCLNLPP
jgi:hypothetical protein